MSFTFFSRRNVLLIVASVIILIAALLSLRMRNGNGTGGDFVEYQMIVANDIPTTVAVAPDNTVWFTIGFADAVGMIRNGKLQRIPKGKKSVEPTGLGVKEFSALHASEIKRCPKQLQTKQHPHTFGRFCCRQISAGARITPCPMQRRSRA